MFGKVLAKRGKKYKALVDTTIIVLNSIITIKTTNHGFRKLSTK